MLPPQVDPPIVFHHHLQCPALPPNGPNNAWNDKPPMNSYNSAPPFTGYPQQPQGGPSSPPPATTVVVQELGPDGQPIKKKNKFGKIGSTVGNAAAGGLGFGAGAGQSQLLDPSLIDVYGFLMRTTSSSDWQWYCQCYFLEPLGAFSNFIMDGYCLRPSLDFSLFLTLVIRTSNSIVCITLLSVLLLNRSLASASAEI